MLILHRRSATDIWSRGHSFNFWVPCDRRGRGWYHHFILYILFEGKPAYYRLQIWFTKSFFCLSQQNSLIKTGSSVCAMQYKTVNRIVHVGAVLRGCQIVGPSDRGWLQTQALMQGHRIMAMFHYYICGLTMSHRT